MPASILKQCLDTYIDPLTYLINLSINQGIFPDELNIAKVITLFTNQMISILYKITDQYLFYLSSQNFLLSPTTYYMIINLVSVRIIRQLTQLLH